MKKKRNIKGLQMKLTLALFFIFFIVTTGQGVLVDLINRYTEINLTFVTYGAAAFSLILGLILAFLLIKYFVTQPFQEIEEVLFEMAKGDLTKTINKKTLKRKDEMGSMAVALKNTQEYLYDLIQTIHSKENALTENANALNSTSQEVSKTTNEVTETMQEIAEGATSQATDLNDILNQMKKLEKNIESAQGELEGMKKDSIETDDVADRGKEKMEILKESIINIQQGFKETFERVEALIHSVEKINGMTEVIGHVSDQTNLLALNAAIEAARAGEAGKGFAVVAEEIRKLAEESTRSVDQITEIIENISKESKEVRGTVKKVDQSIGHQVKGIEDTVENFNLIIASVDRISPRLKRNFKVMEDIERSKVEVLEKTEQSSAIAQEFSASCEEVSAAAEEMNASTHEITSAINNLQEISGELNEVVKDFKIKE